MIKRENIRKKCRNDGSALETRWTEGYVMPQQPTETVA